MPSDSDLDQTILQIAYQLAEELPVDQIGFADIARRANVHWTTVRRHVKSRENLRKLLRDRQAAQGVSHTDTRSRILSAAAQVFADRGYSGASLDDVATAADLTKGAVYWHFSSKSDLFLSLLEKNVLEHIRLLPDELMAVADAENRPQAVVDWLASEFGRLTADRRQAMLFFEFVSSTRDEAIELGMQRVRRRALETALPLIESLQARGLLTDQVSPMTLGLMVQALFDGLTLGWIVDETRMNLSTMVGDLAKLLLNGIHGPNLTL